MKKSFNTTMAASDADKYNPNDPRSVDSFWEGASIEHKGKVVGIASSADISSLFGMIKSDKSVSVEEMNVEESKIPQAGDETVLHKKPDNLSAVLDILGSLPDDFMQDGRNDLPPQERDFDL